MVVSPLAVKVSATIFFIAFPAYIMRLMMAKRKLIRDIPIIPSNSLLGFTLQFFGSTDDCPQKAIKFICEKQGKVAQFLFLFRPYLLVSDPKLAKQILRDVTGKLPLAGEQGTRMSHKTMFSLSTGEEWKIRRNALRGGFAMSRLQDSDEMLKNLIAKVCSTVRDSVGTPILLDKVFSRLTLDTICALAFQYDLQSLDGNPLYNDIVKAIGYIFELSWIVIVFPFADFLVDNLPGPFSKYNWAQRTLHNFSALILKHLRDLDGRAELQQGSLAFAFLQLSRHDMITEEDILAEIRLFLIAGSDTTSHALSLLVYALIKNPTVLAALQGEIDDGDAEQHPYLEAVIKESMRKYPTAALGSQRVVVMEDGYTLVIEDEGKKELSDGTSEEEGKEEEQTRSRTIVVPKGTRIIIPIYSLHHIGVSHADIFDPSRFLSANQTPAAYAGCSFDKSDSLTFCPFSYGPRNCIGMNLALAEIRACIKPLLREFAFEFADEFMNDEERAFETFVTMRPKGFLKVYAHKRHVDGAEG